jgi:choline dehydrogenase
MAYIRGARADYDGWARDGAKGWAYDDLLPYFRRSEANERGEDQFHGKLGPWTVSDGRSRYSLMDAFVEAGVEAGHLRNPDFNGEKQDGLGLYRSRSATACAAAPPSPFFIPRLAVQT